VRSSVPLVWPCVAEFAGTFILVFLGVGAVHVAVLTGALEGLWQVAVVWGVAVALAVYATSAISGGHINPAITVALAALGGFPKRKVPPYIVSQLAGAVVAAAVLHGLFASILDDYETARGLVRGGAGSEISAMCYGQYFPNPALREARRWSPDVVTHLQAMAGEGIGTALLAFFVFALTDPRNRGGPGPRLAPAFIGLTVAVLIAVVAPLTQAGLNPARDLGPRLFALVAGWGRVAVPGPRGGCITVYVVAPTVGALVGAGAYTALARAARRRAEAPEAAGGFP